MVKKAFSKSKLRKRVDCDNFEACRCIYSNNDVGKKDGTRKEDNKILINCKENGYVCVKNTGSENYVMRRLIRCGNHIET